MLSQDLMFDRIVSSFLVYLVDRKKCGIAQVAALRTEPVEMLAFLGRTAGWRGEQFRNKGSWFL